VVPFADSDVPLRDVFGSGWAWLVKDGLTLSIATTPHQGEPLMEGRCPILGPSPF